MPELGQLSKNRSEMKKELEIVTLLVVIVVEKGKRLSTTYPWVWVIRCIVDECR